MEKAFVLSLAICVIYFLLKYAEMRYLEKKVRPLRESVRDVIMVFMSAFVCSFGFIHYRNKIDDFVAVITNTNILKAENTQVFTGLPGF
jgi:hypothetical protein